MKKYIKAYIPFVPVTFGLALMTMLITHGHITESKFVFGSVVLVLCYIATFILLMKWPYNDEMELNETIEL